jgi:hypothetical protein
LFGRSVQQHHTCTQAIQTLMHQCVIFDGKDTGVVEENVDLAEGGEGFLHAPRAVVRLRVVGQHEQDLVISAKAGGHLSSQVSPPA